jgi:predicted transcriptional regulator of viral defense system
MSVSSSANIIKTRIMNSPDGSVFTTVDFADVIENSRVGVILSRLEEDGVIRRVMRGIYDKPVYNDFLKEYIAPSPSLVAEALARNFGWTIVPCGDTALNILGLSTQVPAAWSYVSDGTYKEYTYDNTTIKFKRTTNKEISKLSYKTALIVQALKALGKDNIDDTIINKLKNDLTDEEKTTALLEAKAATSWIYEYIKQICKGDEK